MSSKSGSGSREDVRRIDICPGLVTECPYPEQEVGLLCRGIRSIKRDVQVLCCFIGGACGLSLIGRGKGEGPCQSYLPSPGEMDSKAPWICVGDVQEEMLASSAMKPG